MRFVVGPAALHLDPELEEDARVEQPLELLARFGADPLQPFAAAADDHPLVGVALDDDGRGDAAEMALLLVAVDDDRRGVGQLVAGEPEQLLADDLGGEEAIAAVGERVFGVQPRLLGQVRLDDRRAAGRRRPVASRSSARIRRTRGAAASAAATARGRRGVGRGRACWRRAAPAWRVDEREHRRVAAPNLPASTTSKTTSTSASDPVTARLSERLSAAAWRVWKPGVSTKTNWLADRADAGDPVPRRLRLARGDADLLRDQRVDQGRLADVRPADDRDQAAALRGAPERLPGHQDLSGLPGSSLARSASSMRRAASCSAARRDLPSPVSLKAERRDGALDLERLRVRLAARREDAIARHREPARLQPFLQLGLGVLAPAADVGGLDDFAEQALHEARAASKPPSRKVAPISASSASARIDARIAPPPRASPSPRRSDSGRPSWRAAR